MNHASIIDGVRLSKSQRLRYANNDMADLEARLVEAKGARVRLIATDGVFSMDGYLAPLDAICELAERPDADDPDKTGNAAGRRIRQPPADRNVSLHRAQAQYTVENPDLEMVGLGRRALFFGQGTKVQRQLPAGAEAEIGQFPLPACTRPRGRSSTSRLRRCASGSTRCT